MVDHVPPGGPPGRATGGKEKEKISDISFLNLNFEFEFLNLNFEFE